MSRSRKTAVDVVRLRCPCEWSGCGLLFNSLSILQEHQLDHFKEVSSKSNLSRFIICRICEARLDATDIDAIERHSHYHVWTLSLRVYGRHVQQMNEWPDCVHAPITYNVIPDLPSKFHCAWEYCGFMTNDIFLFYDHVSVHPEEYTDLQHAHGPQLRCLWGRCDYIANGLKSLHSHLDVHSQRKHIGCPTCGMLFTNRKSFEEHLEQQRMLMLGEPVTPSDEPLMVSDEPVLLSDKPVTVSREQVTVSREPVTVSREPPKVSGSGQLRPSVKPLSCPHCDRVFAAEDLLMTHVRRHNTNIKCEFCGITLRGKTALDRHVLLRHMDQKCFLCPHCDYRSKTSSALKSHIEQTHFGRATTSNSRSQDRLIPGMDLDEPEFADHIFFRHEESNEERFSCPHCGYQGKTSSALKSHIQRMHFAGANASASRRLGRLAVDMNVDEPEFDDHIFFRHEENDGRGFSCPYCDYQGKTSIILKSHVQRIHSAKANASTSRRQGRFAQDVDVDAPEFDDHTFFRHEEGNIECYSCPYCDYQGKTSSALKSHMQRMHFAGDNASTSRRLGRLAPVMDANEPEFDDHIFFRHEESNEERFSCPHCGYQGKTSSALKSHIQRMHFAGANASASRKRGRFAVDMNVDDSAMPSAREAESGAMSLPDDDDSNRSSANGRFAVGNSSPSSITYTAPDDKSWIHCHYPGCDFKTTHFGGYSVHYNSKHAPKRSPSPDNPQKIGYYACHLCPEVRRTRPEMTRHLRREHQMTREAGYTRIGFTLASDGKFWFQPPDPEPTAFPPAPKKRPYCRGGVVAERKPNEKKPLAPVAPKPSVVLVSPKPLTTSVAPKPLTTSVAPKPLTTSVAPKLSTAPLVLLAPKLPIAPVARKLQTVLSTPKLPIAPLVNMVPILPVPVGKVPISRLVKRPSLPASNATRTSC